MSAVWNSLANPAVQLILGAVFGLLLSEGWSVIKTWARRRHESIENLDINLTGEWFAAWQVSINGVQGINVEKIALMQRGAKVLIRNVEKCEAKAGGYHWTGSLAMTHGKYLTGTYQAIKTEMVASRGALFYAFFSHQRVLVGKWVGNAHDGDVQSGLAAIAKDAAHASAVVRKMRDRLQMKVGIINFSLPSMIAPANEAGPQPLSNQAEPTT